MNGVPLPAGMQESEQLPEPVFTPSTKAEQGEHDENINFEDAVAIVGKEMADQAREASLELYRMASELALTNGIVIADTKFELGFIDGELRICDEVLTMDSSRFWPADQVTLGARRRASTSSRCTTTPTHSGGTRPHPRRRCPTRSSPPPAPATSRPTRRSPV